MRFKRNLRIFLASIIPLLAVVAVLILLSGGRVQAAPNPHTSPDAPSDAPPTTIQAPHAQTETADCWFTGEWNESTSYGRGCIGGASVVMVDDHKAFVQCTVPSGEDAWPYFAGMRVSFGVQCEADSGYTVTVRQTGSPPMKDGEPPYGPPWGSIKDGYGSNFDRLNADGSLQEMRFGIWELETIRTTGDGSNASMHGGDDPNYRYDTSYYVEIYKVNGRVVSDDDDYTDCVPIESLAVTGPVSTVIGSWNDYQAIIFPSFATTDTGFNIDWEATGGDSVIFEDGDHADIVWYYTGIQTVTVSAVNMCSYRTAWMTTVVTNTFIPPISVTLPISPGVLDCADCAEVEGEYDFVNSGGLWGTMDDILNRIYSIVGANSLKLMCYLNCYVNYGLSWGGYAIDMIGYWLGTAVNGLAEWLWWTFQPAIQCLFSWFTNAAHYVADLNHDTGTWLQGLSDNLAYFWQKTVDWSFGFAQGLSDEMAAWVQGTDDSLRGWLIYEDGMLKAWLNDAGGKITDFFSSVAGFLRAMVRLGVMIAAWITAYFFGLIAKLIGYVNWGVTLVSELVRGFRDAITADSEAGWKTTYSGLYYFWRGLTYFEDTAGAGPLAVLNLFSLGIIGIRLFFWTIGQVNDFMEDIARW